MERVSNNNEVLKNLEMPPLPKKVKGGKNTLMKKLVGVKELSEILSIPTGTIYNMVSKKEIPVVKIGHRTLFDLKTIDAWVEERSFQPADFSNFKGMNRRN